VSHLLLVFYHHLSFLSNGDCSAGRSVCLGLLCQRIASE